MERFYSKGYVCYLRASQMNDLIEKGTHDEQALGALEKIATAYQKNRENSKAGIVARMMNC